MEELENKHKSIEEDLSYLKIIEEAAKDAERLKENKQTEEYIYIDPASVSDVNQGINKILVNELNKRQLTVTEVTYEYQKMCKLSFTKARSQFYNDKQVLSKNKNMTLQTLFRLCKLLNVQVDLTTGN